MDAASALADLTEISSHLEAAVLVDGKRAVLASTCTGEGRGESLAQAGLALLDAAESRFGTGGRAVTQLEAALREGSVFVSREGELAIVARTTADPPSGLVLYDLKACLRTVGESRGKPKGRSRAAKKAATADA